MGYAQFLVLKQPSAKAERAKAGRTGLYRASYLGGLARGGSQAPTQQPAGGFRRRQKLQMVSVKHEHGLNATESS